MQDYRSIKNYSNEHIEQVRKKFSTEVERDSTQFEDQDVSLVQSDDWSVCRFLFIHQNHVDCNEISLSASDSNSIF